MAKAAKPSSITRSRGAVAKKRRNKPSIGKVENMTEERWRKVVTATAEGANRADAAKSAGIRKSTLDAYLVTSVTASGQLHEAKLLWLRKHWPDERVDEVLEQIMRGKTLPEAFDALDITGAQQSGLYRLMLNDKAVRKRYDEAREIQAETFVDEIIAIADESENDFTKNGKPDHELVNRSRLRVDTRKFVMSTMNAKRFSDKRHHIHEGELNVNHAAVLAGGRKRLEKLENNRKGATIDNNTGSVS